MSLENSKTLAAYDEAAQIYLDIAVKKAQQDPERAAEKEREMFLKIQKAFDGLPEGAKILEVGSANGENAKLLQKLGYEVIASDNAPAFLRTCKKANLRTIKFNILEDQFPAGLSGIFCWRVFVHFTRDDMLCALNRAYEALLPGGRIVFNIIDRSTHDCTEEMKDFPDEYRMGVERFYAYYSRDDLNDIISQTKFKILDTWQENGGHNSWFCFVLEKNLQG